MSITAPEYDCPILYNEDYLILLMRDPNCLYAYWELSSETQSLVNSRFSSEREEYQYILRVYDLTGLEFNMSGCHSSFDIKLQPMTDNYFINKIDSNRSYCVELGCYERGDDFIGIMRSNVINTPRNCVANTSDPPSSRLSLEENAKGSILIGSFANLGIYGDSNQKTE